MPKPNTYVQLLQAHLDRRLADVYKNRQPMDPFERRYPEIKPVTYNRKKYELSYESRGNFEVREDLCLW